MRSTTDSRAALATFGPTKGSHGNRLGRARSVLNTWLRPAVWLGAAWLATSAAAAELVGFASLPADTFAPGPTSGQFVESANGRTLPLVNKQPVQGFSAVLPGPIAGTYRVMADNGFGTKANSPDALLRVYSLRPEFRRWDGRRLHGSGAVHAVDWHSGKTLARFSERSFITLSDPHHRLGFHHVADRVTYPYAGSGAGSADLPVDPAIRRHQWLTGGDLDIESFRQLANGHYWFGEEFGPFLVETDEEGQVLQAEVPLPGVKSPDNPFLGTETANLGSSRGFEGMALNPAGTTLYTLLEGTVTGDEAGTLRIHAFDVARRVYTGQVWHYKLDDQGTNIGDMTAVNDHQFLAIERNGTTEPRFKKIFLIDLTQVDSGGHLVKTEVVDLMNLADPHDLNQDGAAVFTFPFVTIEDVLVLNPTTLLVLNDNNYPGSSRTDGVPDPNEFLEIRLDAPLPVAARGVQGP